MWRRWCSGRRRARPGPATAHGHRSQAPHPGLGPTSAKRFALLASISVHTRKSSPSTAKTAQNQRFFACRANFFALTGATSDSEHPPTASPETGDTNAGGSLPRDETTDTTASSSSHTFETADTFARTKQPIPGHFLPAKASRVSCTPRRAPAKAPPVSPSPDATPTAQTSRGVRTCHKAGGTLAA